MATQNIFSIYRESVVGIVLDIVSKICITVGLAGGAWAFNKIEKHEVEIAELKTSMISDNQRKTDAQVEMDRRLNEVDSRLKEANSKIDKLLELILEEKNAK